MKKGLIFFVKVIYLLKSTKFYTPQKVDKALRNGANSVFHSFAKIGIIRLSKLKINFKIIDISARKVLIVDGRKEIVRLRPAHSKRVFGFICYEVTTYLHTFKKYLRAFVDIPFFEARKWDLGCGLTGLINGR